MTTTPTQLLEFHMRSSLALLMPKDRPGLTFANLTLMWAFCVLAVFVLPVVLVGSVLLGLILFPVFFFKALADRRHRKVQSMNQQVVQYLDPRAPRRVTRKVR